MKSFDEIYLNICQECKNGTIRNAYQEYKNKNVRYGTIILVIWIITILTMMFLPYRAGAIMIIISVITSFVCWNKLYKNRKKYSEKYKESVITSLITNYDQNLRFDKNRSMNKDQYIYSEFDEGNDFEGNDLIYGKIEGIAPIEIGDIYSAYVYKDEKGNVHRDVLFQGLFAEIKLPENIMHTVKIRTNKSDITKVLQKELFVKTKKKLDVKMDSNEFEKYFDIYSTDNIIAMRILTAEVMEYLISIRKRYNKKFEIIIKKGNAYIRIPCEDMFEAIPSKDPLNKEVLSTYYEYLHFICKISRMIYKIIRDKEF